MSTLLPSFLVRDAQENVLCYSDVGIPRAERAQEVIRFADFWKKQTGGDPQELVFDSQLTTYRYLQALNERGIGFITLRRRSRKMLAKIYATPPGQWRRITLPALTRTYRTPRILDETVELKGYKGLIRQITVIDLGHEEPTILLTNQLRVSPRKLITRYAQRILIENGIADAINFFHIDALSSMVGLKVDFDLLLTLMASSLYRLMAQRIGREYRRETAKTLFRKLFDAGGEVQIAETTITVQLAKRAHNPILMAAGFADEAVPVPWLDNKRLVLRFA